MTKPKASSSVPTAMLLCRVITKETQLHSEFSNQPALTQRVTGDKCDAPSQRGDLSPDRSRSELEDFVSAMHGCLLSCYFDLNAFKRKEKKKRGVDGEEDTSGWVMTAEEDSRCFIWLPFRTL